MPEPTWTLFRCIATTQFPYQPNKEHHLNINIGDEILIYEQSKDWFRGCLATDIETKMGIFPKTFVLLHKPTDSLEYDIQSDIDAYCAWELTPILRVWRNKLEELFMLHDYEEFSKLATEIVNFVDSRTELARGVPPHHVDQILTEIWQNETRLQIKYQLPLRVRDDLGFTADPNKESPLDIYSMHMAPLTRLTAFKDLLDKSVDIPKSLNTLVFPTKSKSKNDDSINLKKTFQILFTYKNCIADFKQEPVDLYFSLYDAKSKTYLTGDFLIKLTKAGMAINYNPEEPDYPTIFPDIDASMHDIYLVCKLLRTGVYDRESKKNSPADMDHPLYRPFGIGVQQLTSRYLTDKLIASGKATSSQQPLRIVFGDEAKYSSWVEQAIANDPTIKPLPQATGIIFDIATYERPPSSTKWDDLVQQHPELANVRVTQRPELPSFFLPGTLERHDLYLRLVSGDFSHEVKKKSQKNIFVKVQVISDNGTVIPNVIIPAVQRHGIDSTQPEIDTVCIKNNVTPAWDHRFMIQCPLDLWNTCHIKLTYFSTSGSDKSAKPFAFSFMRFTRDETDTNGVPGVTVVDKIHTLPAFKHTGTLPKPGTRENVFYLRATATEMDGKSTKKMKNLDNLLIPCKTDHVNLETKLVSTRKTHDANLAGLISWKECHASKLKDTLKSFSYIEIKDIIKFLQEVFDAFFDIIEDKQNDKRILLGVYDAFVDTLVKISSPKSGYGNQLRPIIDAYIDQHFHCSVAHIVLVSLLNESLDQINENKNKNRVRDSFKSLELLIKFIIRSRLFVQSGIKQSNEDNLLKLFAGINKFMLHKDQILKTYQTIAIQSFGVIIDELSRIYSPDQLATIYIDFFVNIQNVGDLYVHKLEMINLIMNSHIVVEREPRAMIIQCFGRHLADHVQGSAPRSPKTKDEIALTVYCLQNIICHLENVLDRLRSNSENIKKIETAHGLDSYNLGSDGNLLSYEPSLSDDSQKESFQQLTGLLPVCFAGLEALSPLANGSLVHAESRARLTICIYTIFHLIPTANLEEMLSFLGKQMNTDLAGALRLLTRYFTPLTKKWPFPSSWDSLSLFVAQVAQKILVALGDICVMQFLVESFNPRVWENYYSFMFSFLNLDPIDFEVIDPNNKTLATLNLIESLTTNKHTQSTELPPYGLSNHYKINSFMTHGDYRIRAAQTLKRTWDNLEENQDILRHKICGSILDLSTSENKILSEIATQIYFSILLCEYNNNQNFNQTEQDTIDIIDQFVRRGMMGTSYRIRFINYLQELFKSAPEEMKNQGTKFISDIRQLLRFMYDLRQIPEDPMYEDERSLGMLNLMSYLKRTKRIPMYIKYAHMLCKVNVEVESYSEAANVLSLHADLLDWNVDQQLKPAEQYPAQSAFARKEQVFTEIIDYHDKSKDWERAIKYMAILRHQYQHVRYDYIKLSKLLTRESSFFFNISSVKRFYSNYFRVAYFGTSWDETLRNKEFVYKGVPLETLVAFVNRIEAKYPGAHLIRSSKPVEDEILAGTKRHIQITNVKPCHENMIKNEPNDYPPEMGTNLTSYLDSSDVHIFYFDRPFRKGGKTENEFKSLWIAKTFLFTKESFPGLCRRSLIEKVQIVERSPIVNALQDVYDKNDSLLQKIIYHDSHDDLSNLSFFSMTLDGVIDAAVNGGATKYQEAFFIPEFLKEDPENPKHVKALKESLGIQLGLVVRGLELHSRVCGDAMRPMQNKMEKFFDQMEQKMKDELNIVPLNQDLTAYSGPRLGSKATTGGSGGGSTIENASALSAMDDLENAF